MTIDSLLNHPVALIMSLISLCLALCLLGYWYNARKNQMRMSDIIKSLTTTIEENDETILSLTTLKNNLEAETTTLKKHIQNILEQIDQLQKQKEAITAQVRNLEIENANLQNELQDAQNAQPLNRSGIYQTSEEEIAKRIKEALEPWIQRVQTLESELDLAMIDNEGQVTANAKELKLIKALEEKLANLSQELNKKEEENITLRLNVNKVITAYNELKAKIH